MERLIERILRDSGFRSNPYFQSLACGEFDRADFLETQIQFYHAVIYFSVPMERLAQKIPDEALRAPILLNVSEEHGEGDPARSHASTFREFLSRLGGVTVWDIERRALWPEVRLFNTALIGACTLEDHLVGAAMLGMIERMFSEISGWIGQGVVAHGWIAREHMVHYDLHQTLDVRHARDFFDVLRPAWNTGSPERSSLNAPAESRYAIEQGLRLGAATFDSLYGGLYRNRRRRLVREDIGPQARP